VVATGPGAERFAIGDEVMGLTAGGGGHAELAVLHESAALPKPSQMGWAQAGGFTEVFATAHDALFTQCNLAPGERLLVSGGAGGVGIAAVQLGVAAGAHVVASVRDPARRDAVAAFGAEVIAPDRLAGHAPYDVVLEMFPRDNLADDIRALAMGGRIHIVSPMGGADVEIHLPDLMARCASIHASGLKNRGRKAIGEVVDHLGRQVGGWLESGAVSVPIQATWPLDEAASAYKQFSAGGKLGKIVLTMG
jgi:NADPH:quinone reductase